MTVYVNRTTNGNPTYDPKKDLPQSGIDVRVTDASGGTVSGKTDAQGKFVLTPSAKLMGGRYRVEVSVPANLNYLVPASAKSGGGYSSFVNFVDLGDGRNADIRTAVWNPRDYSSAQELVIPFQRNPYPSPTREERSLVIFNKDGRGDQGGNLKALARQEFTGSLYGTAYDPTGKRVFSGAIAKRHTPYGVGGPGAIYVSPLNGKSDGSSTRLFATVPHAGSTQHTKSGSPTAYSRDVTFFEAPGKESLGDVELSEDGKTLYTVNMNTKSLVAFDTTGETASAPSLNVGIPNPGCVGGEWRPMGLGVRDGKLYVGGVCDASASLKRSDLKATVYTFDGKSFQQVLSKSLDYRKGFSFKGAKEDISARWNPWIDDRSLSRKNYISTLGGFTRPMPELSDIDFNQDGSMILGFRDRLGDQLGYLAYPPVPGKGGATIETVIGGGVNLACKNADGSFSWEGTNGCPNNVVPRYNGGLAPGVVKFFVGQTVAGLHQEPSQGGVLSLLNDNNVVTSSIDPVGRLRTAGVQYLSLKDGTGPWKKGLRGGNRSAQLAKTTRDSFGKGNGLGDLSAITSPAPIQIGNRVWFDANADGIQTPGEPSVPGLTVKLIKNGTVIGTRTTDANGEYYFSSTDSDLDNKFFPGGGDYTVEFVKPDKGQLMLSGGKKLDWINIQFTTQKVGNNRSIDSKPNPGDGRAQLTVGGAGFVDHTIDAGLVEISPVKVPGYVVTKKADKEVASPGDTVRYTVTVTNTGATDPVDAGFTDDLSEVLTKADWVGFAGGQAPGGASYVAPTLTWSGEVSKAGPVVIEYDVKVKPGASGEFRNGVVTGDDEVVPPVVTRISQYQVEKRADPRSGSAVRGGQKITYTVTGSNTGATVLDPVTITDDMSAVLDKASYNNDLRVEILGTDGRPVSANAPGAVLNGTALQWIGSLQPGQRVQLVYSVTVKPDVAAGVVVKNRLSSKVIPPGNPKNPIVPLPVATEHPVDPESPARPDEPLAITGIGSGIMVGILIAIAFALLGGALLLSLRRLGSSASKN